MAGTGSGDVTECAHPELPKEATREDCGERSIVLRYCPDCGTKQVRTEAHPLEPFWDYAKGPRPRREDRT